MKVKESAILLLLMLLKFALLFFLSNSAFELHRDEYLYYEQGQHLDLGYLENPPLIGFLAYLSSLCGGGFFWIKFWPAVFGVATLWITIQLVKEFGGGFYAQIIAALGIVFSAYIRIHFLFQPNFLDIFFWLLSTYYLVRFINTEQNKYLFLLALSLALGWYSKYSVLFFMLALLLSLLLTYHRTIFLRKPFWLAFLMASLIILPNILWQYFHNWPLLHHMKELQKTQLRHLNRLDFIKEQLLMLIPVVIIWIGGLLWLLRNPVYRVVGYCYLFIIVLLMMGSGKGYYALGAYPMLLAAGGVWAEKLSAKRTWLRYGFALLIPLLSLPFMPLLLPLQQPAAMAAFNEKYGAAKLGLLKWEGGKNHPLQQDFADMLGWKELANKTEIFFTALPDSIKASTIIYCSNYGLAGSLKYFGSNSYFSNKVITDNGTFLLWTPDRLYFRNLIVVSDEEPDKNDEVLRQFKSRTLVDSCTSSLAREYGTKIYYFQNPSDTAWVTATKAFAQMKAQFRR